MHVGVLLELDTVVGPRKVCCPTYHCYEREASSKSIGLDADGVIYANEGKPKEESMKKKLIVANLCASTVCDRLTLIASTVDDRWEAGGAGYCYCCFHGSHSDDIVAASAMRRCVSDVKK